MIELPLFQHNKIIINASISFSNPYKWETRWGNMTNLPRAIAKVRRICRFPFHKATRNELSLSLLSASRLASALHPYESFLSLYESYYIPRCLRCTRSWSHARARSLALRLGERERIQSRRGNYCMTRGEARRREPHFWSSFKLRRGPVLKPEKGSRAYARTHANGKAYLCLSLAAICQAELSTCAHAQRAFRVDYRFRETKEVPSYRSPPDDDWLSLFAIGNHLTTRACR